MKYSSFGFIFFVWKVFEIFLVESFLNLFVLNLIMRVNIKYGDYVESIGFYVWLRNFGVKLDGFIFFLVIRSCVFIGVFNLCRVVYSYVL